jgi:inorganic pyrophosphatase
VTNEAREPLNSLLGLLYVAHPWHGIAPGPRAPDVVTVYVEMVPTDTVKYEVDKSTGHLKLDRPQRYSSMSPAPYGFVPQTFCGDEVAALAGRRTGREGIVGDGDPLDVCVLTERSINHGGVLVTARPIGGLRMFDGQEADDKIVAVLEGDATYGALTDIGACPPSLVDRLRHYFLSYKDMPGDAARKTEITDVYGLAEARDVVQRSIADYRARFGALSALVAEAIGR